MTANNTPDRLTLNTEAGPLIIELDVRHNRLDGSESSSERQRITNRITRSLATASKDR